MDIQIISASAGSGKTYRLAELLEQEVRDGRVRPDAILATTFTKKAAAELQGRVRTKLLAAGLTTQAHQLSASRIGTVNSVCGGLLTDFAFDLGISPAQKVIEEEAVSTVINRAMARVIDQATNKELWQLEQYFPGINTRMVVETIITKARSNNLDKKQILQSGKKSTAEFLDLFGEVGANRTNLDRTLLSVMDTFLETVDTEEDATNDTKKAVATVRSLRAKLYNQKKLPWNEWLRLARIKTGAKSKEKAEKLREIAGFHDNHPQLRKDVTLLIKLVFEIAAKTIEAYQEYKREWGVVDFTDQEALTLKLLNMNQPSLILRDQLDLVLVDEFQDTSPIQLAIFLKLASLAKKSVWVGDQKQAIYGFRDADPSLMDAAIAGILKKEEPETLKYSWRSRPEIVHSTSDIFVAAFANYNFPEQRVRLEPAPPVEKSIPRGLSPVYECWKLESSNKNNDALALANCVQDFLQQKNSTIRDPKTNLKRRVRGGDVAILCRANDICLEIAEALEQQGVKAALPRAGLLSCPETILTLAGMRLLIDPMDSLAKAEIARLLDNPADHNSWLRKALSEPYAKGYDLNVFTKLDQVKGTLAIAGPLQVLDAAMEATEVRKHCLAWGHSEMRLANLDNLRSFCSKYLEDCRSESKGASPAGMLAYLDSLQSDTMAVVQGEDTVQVLTWHKAKGLEWPVTVLFQLDKVYPALPLGVNVTIDADFSLEDPLANRWLRYWPDPYLGKKSYQPHSSGAPFHQRLRSHAATIIHAETEKRQELRLLYVGWTRARDKVILAGRNNFLEKGILRLLVDSEGNHLLEIPVKGKATWADREVQITTRTGSPAEPVSRDIQPGKGYKQSEPKEYPPAFLSASSIDQRGTVKTKEDLGKRLTLKGTPDMQAIGESVHTFLGADDVTKEKTRRLVMATDIIKRWDVINNISPEFLLTVSERLNSWISSKWLSTTFHKEYPVALQQNNGTIVSGFIDLLVETPEGYVIIDHKSFPGGIEEAKEKAASFAGQLGVYAEAVEAATEKTVIGRYIHLPISSIILQIV